MIYSSVNGIIRITNVYGDSNMSDKYYIAADGGGTKLHAILFGDDLKPLSFGLGKAVNTCFTDMEDVKATMDECVDQLFADSGVKEIECVYSTIAGPTDVFLRSIERYAAIKRTFGMSEGYGALAAGIMKQTGILALSGSGSDVYNIVEGRCTAVIGGWGALFGDEGSGYDIGAKALRAIEFATDGRGPDTMMCGQLCEDFGLKHTSEIVGRVYSERDYRRIIASVCMTACRCAWKGDRVAADILSGAGKDLGLQTVTLVKKYNIPPVDIVMGGSVWRNNYHMSSAFTEYVAGRLGDAYPVSKAAFNPVMGGIVHCGFERGFDREDIEEIMCSYYQMHIYEKK